MATPPGARYQASSEPAQQQNVQHETKLAQLSAAVEGTPELLEMVAQLRQDAAALTASTAVRVEELEALKKSPGAGSKV